MGPYLGILDMGLGLDNKLGIRNRGLIKDHENNEFSWFLIKPLAKWLFLHIKLYHLDQGLQKLHKVGGVEFHAHADGVSGQIIQMPPGDQAWPEVPEHHALGEVGRDHLKNWLKLFHFYSYSLFHAEIRKYNSTLISEQS